MKKICLLSVVFILPLLTQAQEIGLVENYKTKKEKRLSQFTPHSKGDVTFSLGMSSISRGYGLSTNIGSEYMLNEKVGLRLNYTTNNLSSFSYWGGMSRLSLDLSYHFIQKNRWDVYAFAGIGAERYRYRIFDIRQEQLYINNRPILNAGVGARYKVTPNFGVQMELGRVSNLGVYKKFNFGKK